MKKLDRVFEPNCIAVFGVSFSNPMHPANVIYTKNHLRYEARTYGINPKGGELYGERIYKSLEDIPEKVDFAILCIRAEYVPQAIQDCISAGVSGAIVISGGFAETGRLDLQEKIVQLSSENNFPVIGPNCLGIYSPPKMDVFFLPYERLVAPMKGEVAILSQSGGILIDLMIKLTQEYVGISRAVSIGNKAIIDEVDLLSFLKDDPMTRVIGIYIEGFNDNRGREFVELVRDFPKPIVMLKSGKTPGGARAVSSHTASLAGDYLTFSEIMKECGVLEAKNEIEFVSYCEALKSCDHKPVKNICIVTGSGGHGAMATDVCYSKGLNLVEMSENDARLLQQKLSPSVQPIASLRNPIDLTGSANDNDFYSATRFAMTRQDVDCVIVLLLPYLPGISSDIGARISLIAREFKKPIITYIPHVDKYEIFIKGFEANGVPVSHSVEGAVYMAESLMRRGQ